jgi:hypothetical protein
MESRPKKLLDQVRDAIRVKHYAHNFRAKRLNFRKSDDGPHVIWKSIISFGQGLFHYLIAHSN